MFVLHFAILFSPVNYNDMHQVNTQRSYVSDPMQLNMGQIDIELKD